MCEHKINIKNCKYLKINVLYFVWYNGLFKIKMIFINLNMF